MYFNPRSREGSDSGISSDAYFLPISIHAPAKGATGRNGFISRKRGNFNPRSREGSDGIRHARPDSFQHFNPRSREGSDGILGTDPAGALQFQSTLPRRERPDEVSNCSFNDIFQSTLPRRERHPADTTVTMAGWISIHAPAKGATVIQCAADRHPCLFQSTLPRRERPASPRYSSSNNQISIHAPAKGATGRGYADYIRVRISIHAPAKGATVYLHISGIPGLYFNPRSREGSDFDIRISVLFCAISIHAPAKGATPPFAGILLFFLISIHAPAKGATG